MATTKFTAASIKYIAVHCSATQPKHNFGVDDIRTMHLKRGFNDVGYHFIIKRDGTVQEGRKLDVAGAHVMGYNNQSLGVCLIGGINAQGKSENNYTLEQFASLAQVIVMLKDKFPKATVQGHRDFPNVAKDCPCFDVKAWYKDTVENKVGSNPIKRAETSAILK